MQKGIDYVAVGVSYYCHDGKGKYLMNKRSKNCRDEHGCWDFGGGSIDFGKTTEETLRAELKEEYCAENIQYFFLGFNDSFREQNGKKVHWIQLHYLVEIDPEEIKNGEPHKFDEIGWFMLDDLPHPLHSQTLKELELYRNKLPI
ncbi:MAG: NUDIX domain-containing protein [Candidatus Paceibacterota bacterium]